jgi:hypothetical protein
MHPTLSGHKDPASSENLPNVNPGLYRTLTLVSSVSTIMGRISTSDHDDDNLSDILATALCCKPEGRGFDTRRDKLHFSIYLILPAALGPRVYSASNRNERKIMFMRNRARPVRKVDNLAAICEPIV